MNDLGSRVAAEFVIVVGLVVAANFAFDNGDLFKRDMDEILIVIGIVWFVGSIVGSCFVSLGQSFLGMILSVFLMIAGATNMVVHNKPGHIIASDDEMGLTEKAEWRITVTYQEYGLESSTAFTFTGHTYDADKAMMIAKEEWNKANPKKSCTRVSKTLCYIPKEYAKEHRYPRELTVRY